MHFPPLRNGFTRGLLLRFFDCSMSLLWLLAAMIPTGAAESRGFFLDGHRDTLAINETAGKVAILVRRCCGADLPPATVEFVTIPGSAEEGADYKGVQTNLVFSAGQTERVVEITLLNDSLIEFSETFTAFLQNPGAGSSLDPQHSLRVEIFDEDQGYLIPYSTLIADQNSRALEVIVNRFGGPSLSASTVDFFTTDGTAVSGRDYVATQRTLAFAPGETEKTVYIPILDDGMPRPWIDFTVSLRNPTGDTPLGWSTSSRVYIDGRNQGFKFRSTVPMQLQESEPYAVIEVMRGGSLLPEATVELFTANGTAWAGLDYSEVKTNLLFAAGQTSQFVWIPLRNDALTEDAETFKVQLRQASGFPLHYSDLALSVQIQDNDQGFVVRPTAPDYGRVQEDQALMHFEVALLGDFDATHAAAVTVATRDDKMAGAVAGQDYQAFEARLVFAPGERVKSFSIAILNDTLIEGLEGFPLYLSEPEGAPLSRYQAWTIGTIMDNESGYRFNEAEEAQDLVFHEGRKASVTIQRNGEFNFNSSVTLKLTSTSALFAEVGSATAGVDFPLTNVLVEFGPGQSRKAVTFDLPDDGVNELEETLYLELEADGDAVPKAHRATRAHILDVGVLPVLVDPEFDTSNPILPSHNNRSAVALADGKIIYAIDRRGYDGNPGSVIQRALPDGRPDPAWIPAVTPSSVTALAPIPTGGVFVGLADGIFSGSQNQWVLRLHSDGTIDRSFNPSTSVLRTISSLTVDAEGRLVAVGSGLATRFLADGRRDPSFRSVFQWLSLEGAQLDHAGNILLRGERTLIRLTPDGLVDRTFHAYFREEGDFVPNYVDTILPLTDGSLLVDGHEGVEQKHVVRRLLADGSLDRDFLPISAGTIRLMSVGDGTVWLVRSSSNEQLMGWFLERLLPDGTRDPSFPSQQIRFTSRYQYPPLLFASLPQGQIMALNPALIEGQPRHGAAKLHPLATNRVVVAAESARISEMAGLATVRLIRGGPATNGLVLDWITEPVSAVPGVDYTFSQGRVNFPAGSHEAEVQVPVLDNNLPDRDRFVQLRFNGGSDATPPPTGFSIANDDPGFPADGIVVLTEGGVLLRPTGWLGSETHYTRVEAGSLGSFQEWFQLSEPFPEMVALGLAVYPNPLFFRVRSIPLSSP